jgi:16S rRNA (adenine1518-N6/adenine1519-N6)-dimethyltransferase
MHHPVTPKKSLGQHFLRDDNIARKIAGSVVQPIERILEVGPGTGVLTRFLLELPAKEFRFIDTDGRMIGLLKQRYPLLADKFLHADFLNLHPGEIFGGTYTLVGNLPYNISSQIFFRIMEDRSRVDQVVCMIQKEVAERISSPPGSRQYGILSVLLQSFYRIEFLFTVSEHVFFPPPRVKSAVIRLRRHEVHELGCDEALFFKVVKTAFNQRRKTLRNSLRSFYIDYERGLKDLEQKRPEQLGVTDFIRLTNAAV